MLRIATKTHYPTVENVAGQLYDDLKATSYRQNHRTLLEHVSQYALLMVFANEHDTRSMMYQHLKERYDADIEKEWIHDIPADFQNTLNLFHETYGDIQTLVPLICPSTLHQFIATDLATLFGLKPVQAPENVAKHISGITPLLNNLMYQLTEPKYPTSTAMTFDTISEVLVAVYLQQIYDDPRHELEVAVIYDTIVNYLKTMNQNQVPSLLLHGGIIDAWFSYLSTHYDLVPIENAELRSVFDSLGYRDTDDVWLTSLSRVLQTNEANKKRTHYSLIIENCDWVQIKPLFHLPFVTGDEVINAPINTWNTYPLNGDNSDEYAQLAFWNGNSTYNQIYPVFSLNLPNGDMLFGEYDEVQQAVVFPTTKNGSQHIVHVHVR